VRASVPSSSPPAADAAAGAAPSAAAPPGAGRPPLSPADERRRAALRRMRVLATSLLVLAAAVYAATAGTSGGWGYVNAAAEAAMVGAVADWFAVTALFRRPLGLPIPHTALIPTRKDVLGRSLEEFVATNFLAEPVVRDKVARAQVSLRAGRWLEDPQHAGRLVQLVAGATRGGLGVLREDEVASLVDSVLLRRLGQEPWAPTAGRLLEQVVAERAHHPVVDLLADEAERWLRDNGDTVSRLVGERAPSWSPGWVDALVSMRVQAEAVRWVADVRDDPDHPARAALDAMLARLAADLQHDPLTRQRAETVKERLLRSAHLPAALSSLWGAVRRILVEAMDDPDSELRQRALAAVTGLGRRLAADAALRARVDATLQDAAGYLVRTVGAEVATVISDTVARWDAADASRRIELHVGRDLQFIRINGTVVGALAGLVIHAVTAVAG
jgi:uncharacterized membrane-anchored protein YjiN (DUF445 family)